MTHEPGQSDRWNDGKPPAGDRPWNGPQDSEQDPARPVPPSNPYGQQYGQTEYGQQQPVPPSNPYGQQQPVPPSSSYGQQYEQNPYGQQQPGGYGSPYAQPPYYTAPQPKVLSLTSMILGIASFIGFGALILPQIAAIITGHMGLKREQPQGRGFAIAGLVLGYVTLLGYGAFWILLIVLGLNAASHPGTYYNQ